MYAPLLRCFLGKESWRLAVKAVMFKMGRFIDGNDESVGNNFLIQVAKGQSNRGVVQRTRPCPILVPIPATRSLCVCVCSLVCVCVLGVHAPRPFIWKCASDRHIAISTCAWRSPLCAESFRPHGTSCQRNRGRHAGGLAAAHFERCPSTGCAPLTPGADARPMRETERRHSRFPQDQPKRWVVGF